jgi:hypothetical protein
MELPLAPIGSDSIGTGQLHLPPDQPRAYALLVHGSGPQSKAAMCTAKIHAADCADGETREGRVDRFERRIQFDGALDAAQRSRLLEIAERCPVDRSLRAEISILTEEVAQ